MNALSRREMIQASAATVAATAVGALPGSVALASAPSQDNITLRLQADPRDYQEVIDAYAGVAPNVTVEPVSVTGIDHAEVATKILASLAAGTPVDIGFAATEATQLYAGEGLAMGMKDRLLDQADDLMEYFSDVSPVLVETDFYEGDLYQLPRDFNAANMWLNTKLVGEAGLEIPGEDWTKDDFNEYAKALTGLGPEGDSFGFAWNNGLWGGWLPWIFVNGSNLLSEERVGGGEWLWDTFYADDPNAEGRGGGFRWPEPQANNAANVEALEHVVALTRDGYAPSVERGFAENLSGFFAADKIGMYPGGGFFTGFLQDAGMEPGTYDAQFWPWWQSQRHQLGVGALWILIGGNEDAAWDFVKWHTGRDVMEMIGFFRVTRTTPARRSMCTAERFPNVSNWNIFYDTVDARPDTGPIPAPVFSIELTNIFTRYTEVAVSLEQSPQDTLDAMQRELEDLYARNA